MLSSLTLNNVALFKKQSIEFQDGFNCLLGQSGAGKSIVIDALSFVLGAKADKGLVRTGEASMRVDAVFSGISNEIADILKEEEIDVEDELIVTRTLSADGKSSIKINGYPSTSRTLQILTEHLVDFCGQHDSVGLLNVQNHLAILDKYAGKPVEELKSETERLYLQVKDIEKQIASLGGDENERERTKELLQYQIDEIEEANLTVGEDEELKNKMEFMSSAENIFEKLGSAVQKLDEGRENVVGMLYEAKNDLSNFSNFQNIEQCRERLENAYYEIKDVAETLADIKSETEFDPKELERIDERLDLIKKLSKKYGKTIVEILDFLQASKQKLENLENSDAKRSDLQTQCRKLSDMRKTFATQFEKAITAQLEELEMKGTFFKVDFEVVEPSKKGYDAVKFMFSANKGQEIKDLHKTASGGELSRLLLAYKNIMLDKENVQSVVFDEIDSGISGHTAGRVAEKLANISKFTQVICITHTPVVASKAGAFLLVEKKQENENTISSVKALSSEEAMLEVARLIDGGVEVSSTAIEHSKKLFS